MKNFKELGYEYKNLNFMKISAKNLNKFYNDDNILCINLKFNIFLMMKNIKIILPL